MNLLALAVIGTNIAVIIHLYGHFRRGDFDG
jgi:hypothetical protein